MVSRALDIADGAAIAGGWEKSADGRDRAAHDFGLTYRKDVSS